MKTLNKIFVLIVIITFIGCDNYLDVKPKGQVIVKTIQHYDLLLNGTETSVNRTTDAVTLILTADDFVSTGSDEELGNVDDAGNIKAAIYRWDKNLFHNNDPQYIWNLPYTNIFTYNLILENIDKAEPSINYIEDDRKRIKAEALVSRAYEYWLLVNTFGKQYSENTKTSLGVPLVIASEISEAIPSRATVQEVYDFILKDVADAIKYLPKNAKNRVKQSKGSAYAFLARFYLSMNNYEKALKNASLAIIEKDIIGDYTSDYADIEEEYNSEQYVTRLSYEEYTYGALNEETIALFEEDDDARLTEGTIFEEDWDIEGKYVNAGSLYVNNAPSVPEMYLIRAECNARLSTGTIDDIINDLNALRSKRIYDYSDLTSDDFADKEEALVFVLRERRREMMLTGLRLFDLKRLNLEPAFAKSVTHTVKGVDYTIEAGANNLILPIPAEVLNFNPNMKQNVRD